MGLNIDFYNKCKTAFLGYSYYTIHVLREYACAMVGATDEEDDKAKEAFPNLVWHSDCEGYYVGFLPEEWSEESHLWVGSVEGLYKELQKISSNMIKNDYDGTAKEILQDFLKAFAEIEYNPEEGDRYTYIIFH